MPVYHNMMLTFGCALFFGVIFVVIAHKLRMSAIVLLLLGGIGLGPEGIGLIHPESLGDGLHVIISLAVGVILFEGGMTLDMRGFRQAPREIRSLLTKGVLVTWLASAAAVHFLFSFEWSFSFLAASLVIVTGPTVIGPMLKRIQVNSKVHSILHWEGVLIDPVGVFIALLCYEWMVTGGASAIGEFALRILVGLLVGLLCGIPIAAVIKRQLIPADSLNMFSLVAAVGIFCLADHFAHESGLLATTIAGFVVGYLDRPQVEQIKRFKAELIELLIGLLFVLLAAQLDISAFGRMGWPGLLIVLIIMFVVRPLNVFLSLWGTSVNNREKLFLSYVAPRGIVAASMASLFAYSLGNRPGSADSPAWFLETFTYSVIAGTVLFQGFTAGWVASLLGVKEPTPRGWLVVGAHRVGRLVASFLSDRGFPAVLIDSNVHNTALARRNRQAAILGNALTIEPDEHPALYGIGNILAITTNEDLNTLVCQRWRQEAPRAHFYRWVSPEYSAGAVNPQLAPARGVWEGLHVGNIRTIHLDDENVEIASEHLTVESIRHPERVLMFAQEELVLPYVPPDVTGPCWVLTYRPFRVRLDVEIRADWIKVSTARSMAEVTRQLLQILSESYPQCNIDAVHEKLVQQEEQYSSLIGYDIALPHSYTDFLDDSIMMVAKLATPLACRHTNEKIRFVFMVLSPEDKPRNHLNALSEISTFIMNEENRRHLAAAENEAALIELFFPEQAAELSPPPPVVT